MRKFVQVSVLPVAALALACGRGKSNEQTATLTDDLRKDLQAASASSVELASTARDYQPTRVVSAIESPATSAPVRRRSKPRPAVRQTAANEHEVAKAPAPQLENKVDLPEPQPVAEAPAPAIDAPTDVAVTPRPTPVGSAPTPPDVSTGGSRGGGLGGIGEAIGTVIGVVIIRGGAGGIDHCDPRTDPRTTNGPIALPDPRIPTRAGGGIIPNNRYPHRPTFPR